MLFLCFYFLLQYIHAAALYFNCSCNRTRINSVSQKSEVTKRNNTIGTSVQMNFDEQASDTSHLTRLNIINSQGDILITQKELNVPYLLAPLRTCQSFKVQKPSDVQGNRYNICNVCHTFRNVVFGLPTFLKNNILSTLSSFIDGCGTMRPLYYPLAVTNICCTAQMAQTNKYLSSLEQIKTVSLESLTQIERSLDNILKELVGSIITPHKRTGLKKNGYNEEKGNNSSTGPQDGTKDTFPPSSLLQEHQDSIDNSSTDVIGNNSCEPKGHVTQFTGAGCHSNRSVNFFMMDSTEYWGVAERLGVNSTPQAGKVALVIADLEVQSNPPFSSMVAT